MRGSEGRFEWGKDRGKENETAGWPGLASHQVLPKMYG